MNHYWFSLADHFLTFLLYKFVIEQTGIPFLFEEKIVSKEKRLQFSYKTDPLSHFDCFY